MGYAVAPVMGALFQSRGRLPTVEALDTPGAQPQFNYAVVYTAHNELLF